MQIFQYKLVLSCDKNKTDFFYKSPARGTIMHGILLNLIKQNNLHDGVSLVRPYTQYVVPGSYGVYNWYINILDSIKGESIINWIESKPESLYSNHYEMALQVSNIELVEKNTYIDILSKSFNVLPPKYVSFDFLTPVIFKKSRVNGYWNWPDTKALTQSVLNKWNSFTDTEKFDSEEILNDLNNCSRILNFNLKSKKVSMDGINIQGTTGNMNLSLNGERHIRSLYNMIGMYSNYCGIGAKTAMGLGAVNFKADLDYRLISLTHK